MPIVSISELKGQPLDWAVELLEGGNANIVARAEGGGYFSFARSFSSDWAFGGPIIQREEITLNAMKSHPPTIWRAIAGEGNSNQPYIEYGETALEAAMRAYLLQRIKGTEETVYIPKELWDTYQQRGLK